MIVRHFDWLDETLIADSTMFFIVTGLLPPQRTVGELPQLNPPLHSVAGLSRRACAAHAARTLLAGAVLAAAPTWVQATKLGSDSPSTNYYFPMARYRYAPRILRAWIAVDELSPAALQERDWEGLNIIADRLDDATTAMPLFTNAIEGARSTKRKTKSETQKEMAKATTQYTAACKALLSACKQKDPKLVAAALADAKASLAQYRELANIDTPDGGMVVLDNSAEGRGGAPDAQYVVPVFSGGSAPTQADFRRLRPMERGVTAER